MKPRERIKLLIAELGFELASDQLQQLDAFASWLVREGRKAGGIGPNEANVVLDRHLLDSLTFLAPLEGPPSSLLDIGSGVGLPGIPLAIALPGAHVTLLDRSGRRCELLRRVLRVLDLDNVEVQQADVAEVTERVEVAVSRASLPPPALLSHLQRLADVGVVAGSTKVKSDVAGYHPMRIESRYLDSPRWLLIMRSS